MSQKYEVVICGGGSFGCFLALLLSQSKIKVALVERSSPGAVFGQGVNCFWPSLNDPPTRAEVSHGHKTASSLNEVCARGVDFFKSNLASFCVKDDMQQVSTAPVRFAYQDFEQTELKKAASFGIRATAFDFLFEESRGALLYSDGESFSENLICSLKDSGVSVIQAQVQKVSESSGGCEVLLDSGERLSTEIVGLAMSLQIADILPQYRDILVPMSDLQVEYMGTVPSGAADLPKGLAARGATGHLAGTFFRQGHEVTVRATGPRFLLPGAGVGKNLVRELGAPAPQLLARCQEFHRHSLFQCFAQLLGLEDGRAFERHFSLTTSRSSFQVDCHPCDELPLVGEFGRHGRLVGSAGWLGCGYSAQAWAAKMVADMIVLGTSHHYPSYLSPRRFHAPG